MSQSSSSSTRAKLISLVTLTVQNSSLILTMHYSRVMPGYDAESRYFSSTAVLLNEVLKFVICVAMCCWQSGAKTAYREVFASDCWKLAIPAALYTLQNSLQYTAVSNLDAATFQVTYQLKILTTAFFSVTMLKRLLSKRQWVALLVLTLGIALVQLPAETVKSFMSTSQTSEEKVTRAEQQEEAPMNQFVGLVSVAVACMLSGLAGVYFEKVLKGSASNNVSVWTRNVQLSMFSIIPALFIGVLGKDGAKIQEYGFFNGYNWVVWLAIFLQAVGGIVVALCVKYADNIAKNFATSFSILISSVASVFLFDDFVLSLNFVLGAALVIYATVLYTQQKPAPAPAVNENKSNV